MYEFKVDLNGERLFWKLVRVSAECPGKWVGGTSMGNKERLKGIGLDPGGSLDGVHQSDDVSFATISVLGLSVVSTSCTC
jgi:hypothetical protein